MASALSCCRWSSVTIDAPPETPDELHIEMTEVVEPAGPERAVLVVGALSALMLLFGDRGSDAAS